MDLSLLHPAWALLTPTLLSIPLGFVLARLLDRPAPLVGAGVDALPLALYRKFVRSKPTEMNWKSYASALLMFNAVLFVLAFALLSFQHSLPLNPDGKGSLAALGYKDASGVAHLNADTALIFNTVCSFVTNTNLQHYSGEQHLSYFSQMGSIVWLQFVTPACGLAAMLAVIRGLRGDRHMGDFYLDLLRIVTLVLIPLAILIGVLLIATGVPMTFEGAVKATTLEGAEQTIARGPVAALVAIKQLGTNGGGFFGVNSAHPFENPSAWSNLISVISIILLPMATIVMFGQMINNRKHAAVIFGVMTVMLLVGLAVGISAEFQPSSATQGFPVTSAPNLEGKETRTGVAAAVTWAAMTTATSNGSVNAMHDSLNPLTGMIPMVLMMLNVDFSGIGAGFLNMLVYIIVAVFIAGLMVGRTPEYLGKKVEAREVKLAMAALLIHPLLICAGTALFAATPWGSASVANPGSHGFSEILYEFTSAAANNGSGFEGLADNVPAWNIATGLVLLMGRFPALILPIALAGFLAAKKEVPETSGTLRTDDFTFAGMLLGTVLLVGALSFLPAVVLGPVAEHLSAISH